MLWRGGLLGKESACGPAPSFESYVFVETDRPCELLPLLVRKRLYQETRVVSSPTESRRQKTWHAMVKVPDVPSGPFETYWKMSPTKYAIVALTGWSGDG